jgi:tRNA(Ile)-lysidine synthase
MLTTQWFAATVNTVTNRHRQIWVAYSGGVDSHVLLHLACESFVNVRVVHINHALSDLDKQWQQHCEQTCADLNLPLQCLHVDAAPKPGQSPEDAARNARRAAWQTMLGSNDLLLLGHHADDQAETILYRLLRGAGPKGLSGIKSKTKLGSVTLFRPLLNITKQEILDYAQVNNLNWLQDQTNADNHFDRNYIRNNILPTMLDRWPAAIANINRAAQLCGNAASLVAQQAAEKLVNIQLPDSKLDLLKLSAEPLLWQYEILRLWLQNHDINPSLQQLKIICTEVISARIDSQPEYIIANRILKRSSNKLYLLANTKLPEFSHSHGRKAKKIFQQHGIPPWERSKYPLVFDGDKLVAIVGLWSAKPA